LIQPNLDSRLPKPLSVVLLTVALIAGVWLRVTRLDQAPPGIYPDEACNGYDAYSILKTGRDHHGNFLPILVQGFNDYRRPLFDYSLIPLVATFGLKVRVVRLGAALWGVVDIIAAVSIAGYLLGLPGAAVTAMLLAVSPWLLPLNRYGIEASATSALGTLSVLSFLLAIRSKDGRLLPLSGVCFGLALYSGSIAVLFIPMLMALLGLIYRRELRRVRMRALLAIGAFALVAMPQALVLLTHPGQMQGHFKELSLIHATVECSGCLPGNKAISLTNGSRFEVVENLFAAWLSYLNPLFLFFNGDKGGHWELLYWPGVGMLLPEQAFLIVLALFAAAQGTRRRTVVVLLGWLMLAAIPAAMLVPAGAYMPEGDSQLPTPFNLLINYPADVPITPGLLFTHPEARHDLFAIIPWILLSAVGFVALIEYGRKLPALKNAVVAVILLGIGFHGFEFIRSYFGVYRIAAEPYFSAHLDEAIRTATRADKSNVPIVISNRIAQSYIQAAFALEYPPALLLKEGLRYSRADTPPALHPHAQPLGFGPFLFEEFETAFQGYPSAIFVVTGTDPAQRYLAPEDPTESMLSQLPHSNLVRLQTLDNVDGSTAFQVYQKNTETCTPEENTELEAGVDTMVCSHRISAPASGGPWRAFVSWNAIINNVNPDSRSIECYVSDGSSRYPTVHSSVPPSDDEQSWYVTARTSHDIGPYEDGAAITLQWHCTASDSLTLLRARTDAQRISYASAYFVSDSTGKTKP
jgi:hypothetical protein